MANYFTDRVVQHPGRVVMTPTGNLNEYDLSRSEGTIATPGTPFSAAAFNEIANIIHAYGTCTTSAGTATKVVSCPGFTLQTGAKITVLFSNENSVSETTYLNVNGTGAVAVRKVTGASFTNAIGAWNAGQAVTFVYTGNYWLLVTDNRKLRVNTVGLPTTSIPANAFGSLSVVPTVPTGYEMVGIVGVSLNASGALVLYQRIDDDGVTVKIGCRNVTSAAVNQSGYVQVLFAPI